MAESDSPSVSPSGSTSPSSSISPSASASPSPSPQLYHLVDLTLFERSFDLTLEERGMAVSRKFKESPMYQGTDEEIAYRLLTTPWGSTPSSPAVVLKDHNGVDLSATCLDGLPSVSGDYVTTPVVKDLVPGLAYRMEIKFTINGQVAEAWGEIWGEV